jgi:signal transduction histidine kinase
MSHLQRYALMTALGLIVIIGLSRWPPSAPLTPMQWFVWAVFVALWVFTSTLGFPIAGGNLNLTPMVAITSLLTLGPVGALWVTVFGSLGYGWVRMRYGARLGFPAEADQWIVMTGLAGANIFVLGGSLWLAHLVYSAVGGATVLQRFQFSDLARYAALAGAFFLVNFVLLGLYISLERHHASTRRAYFNSFTHIARYELLPQIFPPLIALLYADLGAPALLLFAVGLVVISLLMRAQLLAQQNLQQSLTENQALHALGQAFARTLDRTEIFATLRAQLPRVIPARHFYVALYDPATDEISFPLYVEDDQPQTWASRRAGQGLTEHIVRTQQSMVMRESVAEHLKTLGIVRIGRPAKSWMGAPILAGGEVLGVLALQSFSVDEPRYGEEHRPLLASIAAQLAVALHNARLYSQTDEALAQRVQQLSSILETTRDGILLLDLETVIVTLNRAAAERLATTRVALQGRALATQTALLTALDFTPDTFQATLRELQAGRTFHKHRYATIAETDPATIERTLTGVKGPRDQIAGWLLVLRDVSEEVALARWREDLSRMLVHDMRSPMGSIITSLDTLTERFPPGADSAPLHELVRIARDGSARMLQLVDELLEISQLEAGQFPLQHQRVSPNDLVSTVVERLRPVAEAATVRLHLRLAPELPPLRADTDVLGRVLGNLVDNAIKFTPDGKTVTVWAKPCADGAQFGVSDEGPGLSPEQQARLFQKFQQIHGVRGRRKGSGLGLAFCKLAVDAHGGRIWIESAPGAGSTFTFCLAAERPNPPPD